MGRVPPARRPLWHWVAKGVSDAASVDVDFGLDALYSYYKASHDLSLTAARFRYRRGSINLFRVSLDTLFKFIELLQNIHPGPVIHRGLQLSRHWIRTSATIVGRLHN